MPKWIECRQCKHDQDILYADAEKELQHLSEVPMRQFNLADTLFLSTRCRDIEGKLCVVGDFTEKDLVRLRAKRCGILVDG